MSMFGWLNPTPYPTMKWAIVNLKGGPGAASFRGVIWERRAGFLVLRNVETLRGRGETVPMEGEVLVYERDIEFIQVIGAG